MASGKQIKGMVSVGDNTYRLERVEDGFYEVVRLSDEVMVGRFAVEHKVRLEPREIDPTLLRRIAREAIQRGKTSWVFHESPRPPLATTGEHDSPEDAAPLKPRRLAPV
jgi:hypothetical protein